MAAVLHVLKPGAAAPDIAGATIEAQVAAGDTVTVALLHEAPAPPLPPGVRVHRVPSALSWEGLLELIFRSDHVIPW